jgi:hypothetical protein
MAVVPDVSWACRTREQRGCRRHRHEPRVVCNLPDVAVRVAEATRVAPVERRGRDTGIVAPASAALFRMSSTSSGDRTFWARVIPLKEHEPSSARSFHVRDAAT